MEVLKAANLAAAFLLEICLIGALAYWGFNTGQIWITRIGLGIGVPLVAIVIWGYWMAPNSRRRIKGIPYFGLKLVLFIAAVAALYFAGQPSLSAVLGLFYMVNQIFIFVWNQ
jgi:hypothetical protein